MILLVKLKNLIKKINLIMNLIELNINNKNIEFKQQQDKNFQKIVTIFFLHDFIINDNLYFTSSIVTSNKSLLFDYITNNKIYLFIYDV